MLYVPQIDKWESNYITFRDFVATLTLYIIFEYVTVFGALNNIDWIYLYENPRAAIRDLLIYLIRPFVILSLVWDLVLLIYENILKLKSVKYKFFKKFIFYIRCIYITILILLLLTILILIGLHNIRLLISLIILIISRGFCELIGFSPHRIDDINTTIFLTYLVGLLINCVLFVF